MGNPITLTCEVEGGFPVVDMSTTTAWYRDGEPVIGTTGRVLSLTAEMGMDGDGYACAASNDAGEAVSEELVLIVGGEKRRELIQNNFDKPHTMSTVGLLLSLNFEALYF